MCMPFSCLSDKDNNLYYFNAKDRANPKLVSRKEDFDSHSSIIAYKFKDADDYRKVEDRMKKWEYNIFTKELKLDQFTDLGQEELEILKAIIKRKIEKINFSKIYPSLHVDLIDVEKFKTLICDPKLQRIVPRDYNSYILKTIKGRALNSFNHLFWNSLKGLNTATNYKNQRVATAILILLYPEEELKSFIEKNPGMKPLIDAVEKRLKKKA